MIKIKDLTADDFPGVDEQKFQEWQDAFAKKTKIEGIIVIVIIVLNVFSYIAFKVLFIPSLLLLLLILFLVNLKQFKLRRGMGITGRDIRRARKGFWTTK